MKTNKIAIAVMAVFAGASGAMAAEGTLSGLALAGDRISAVDMKKDFTKAGDILDGFFSGSASKKGQAPLAVAGGSEHAMAGPAANAYGQTSKDLCNAEAARITRLGASVAELPASGARKTLAAQTRGSSWTDDFNTVIDYAGHVGGHALDTALDAGSVIYNGVVVTQHEDGHLSSNVTDIAIDAHHTYQAATNTY